MKTLLLIAFLVLVGAVLTRAAMVGLERRRRGELLGPPDRTAERTVFRP